MLSWLLWRYTDLRGARLLPPAQLWPPRWDPEGLVKKGFSEEVTFKPRLRTHCTTQAGRNTFSREREQHGKALRRSKAHMTQSDWV